MTTIETMRSWSAYNLPLRAFPDTTVAVQAMMHELRLHAPKPKNHACRPWVRDAPTGTVLEVLQPWLEDSDNLVLPDLPVEVCTGCMYDNPGQEDLEDAFWSFDQAAKLAHLVGDLRKADRRPEGQRDAAKKLMAARHALEFQRRGANTPSTLHAVAHAGSMRDNTDLAACAHAGSMRDNTDLAAWYASQLTEADQLIAELTTELRAQTGAWTGARQLIIRTRWTSGMEAETLWAYAAAADLRRPQLPTHPFGPILSIPAAVPVDSFGWLPLGPDSEGKDLEVVMHALLELDRADRLTHDAALAVGVALT